MFKTFLFDQTIWKKHTKILNILGSKSLFLHFIYLIFRSGSDSGLVTLNKRTIALDLTILELIARGRYGEVHRAHYRGSEVAVKMFYTTEEESWKNERDIYQTQMLNHENILRELIY
jgi:hypothetical protein